jgi:hypothetical protein
VPEGGRSLTFELEPSFETVRGRRLLVVRLNVGLDIAWDMIPNPTVAQSRIRPRAVEELRSHEGDPARRGNLLILRNLTIAGQPVADLPVLVDPAVSRLRMDGILGLDFFEQFEEVRWQPRTRLVTLIEP